MTSYILRRVIYMILLMWLLTVVSFVIIQLPKGDYVSTIALKLSIRGEEVSKELLDGLRRRYGLDRPVHVQYLKWFGNVLRGDPPSRIRLFHEGRLVGPYVYGVTTEVDAEAFRRFYTEDRSVRYPLRFFTEGAEYRLLGLFPTRVRLFGVEQPGAVFLFGSDKLSRDLYSRTICAARISLSIGLLGVASSFLIGIALGGLSGYYGGGWTCSSSGSSSFSSRYRPFPCGWRWPRRCRASGA